MKQYGIYRLYDRHDRLLYIGKSDTTGRHGRLADHRKKWWGRRIHRATWVGYPTEREALIAEAAAIRRETPAHNRQHNGGRHRRRQHHTPIPNINPGPLYTVAVLATLAWVAIVAKIVLT